MADTCILHVYLRHGDKPSQISRVSQETGIAITEEVLTSAF